MKKNIHQLQKKMFPYEKYFILIEQNQNVESFWVKVMKVQCKVCNNVNIFRVSE